MFKWINTFSKCWCVRSGVKSVPSPKGGRGRIDRKEEDKSDLDIEDLDEDEEEEEDDAEEEEKEEEKEEEETKARVIYFFNFF